MTAADQGPELEKAKGRLVAPEAERQVLSGMRRDPSRIAKVATVLRPQHFHSKVYGQIFSAMVHLGDATDVDTLIAQLRAHGLLDAVGGRDALVAILDTEPHAARLDEHVELVLEAAERREAARRGDDLKHAAATGTREQFRAAQADAASIASISSISTPDPDEVIATRTWPKALTPAAFHGVIGELVRVIEPHTESDEAAILFQFLTSVGNQFGRRQFFRVEASRHYPNTFLALVGATSKARKGTSQDHVKDAMRQMDEPWVRNCIQDGLGSGEGLIWAVRDAIYKVMPIKKGGRVAGYEDVMIDRGVDDKRLLFVSGEFAAVLKVCMRDGSILSPVIRNAWDSGMLHNNVKGNPARATDAHISIIGHITQQELLRLLSDTEAANGFGNRFIWIAVRRSKVLPHGGRPPAEEIARLVRRLEAARSAVPDGIEIVRTPAARELWEHEYGSLSAARPGLLGAMLARAEAQVTRLSLIYALADGSGVITEKHLQAALAAWRFAEDSTRYVFGESLGDPIADRILQGLRSAGQAGLSRTQIREIFSGHYETSRIDQALRVLHDADLAHVRVEATGGHPARRWHVGKAPEIKESKETKVGDREEARGLSSLFSLSSQGPATSDALTAPKLPPSSATSPEAVDLDESRRERRAIQECDIVLPPDPASGAVSVRIGAPLDDDPEVEVIL